MSNKLNIAYGTLVVNNYTQAVARDRNHISFNKLMQEIKITL